MYHSEPEGNKSTFNPDTKMLKMRTKEFGTMNFNMTHLAGHPLCNNPNDLAATNIVPVPPSDHSQEANANDAEAND
jgi:hypothetical protein